MASFADLYHVKTGCHGATDLSPGLGVDIDEELAARCPYQRAYLPVNRLQDRTMTNW